jgi:drug/metabolite transporter (DMT)-like permease
LANGHGAALMVVAMAGFAIEDVAIKQLSQTMSVGQILSLIGLAGLCLFALIGRMRGISLLDASFFRPAVMARNLGELIGTGGLTIALSQVPVATVSSIHQALPLLITLGAALFLGERVGWRRWSAIAVGMAGVLIILRPFGADSDPALLWAVAAVLGMAMRDLISRRGAADVPTLRLAAWGFVAVLAAGLLLLATGQPIKRPDTTESALLGVILLLGTSCYYAMTRATQIADISVIAPFRYSRIVFAIVLAWIVLGELPDAPTLIGAALVVAAGLYTFSRERRLERLRKTAAERLPPAPPHR